MNDSPILLIYAPSLQSPDGTTMQLRRLLTDFPLPVWHIHGRSLPVLPDIPRNCLSLQIPLDPWYPFHRGGGFIRRTWRRWIVPSFVKTRLADAIRQSGRPRPQVAYVVVYDELNAVFARKVLRAARIDHYVLHLMDLFHSPLNPRAQPSLAKLIANASRVLAVSTRLADEIAPIARQPVEILPLVPGFVGPPASLAKPAVPYMMMSGALYAADPTKLQYLNGVVAPAWLELLREFPEMQWLYAGAEAYSLSPQLRAIVKNCGMLPAVEWCETLAAARCALLPVHHRPEEHFRYSVPSRLVDYLAAGVPIIAPSSPNTATGDFLESLSYRGVIIADTQAEVHTALRRLFCDDDFHRGHVIAALTAAAGFSVARTQRRLLDVIRQIA